MNFCVTILILIMEEKATFSAYCALLFQENMNVSETHKKRFVQHLEMVL